MVQHEMYQPLRVQRRRCMSAPSVLVLSVLK